MSVVQVCNAAVQWRRLLVTNSTTAAYAVPADTLTAPDGSTLADGTTGYIDTGLGRTVSEAPAQLKLEFYGVGADNTTGNCRVYGVSPIYGAADVVVSYTHTLLVDYAFTLGTTVGVAGGVVPETARYADTIVRTIGNANVSDQFVSPANELPAHALVNVQGFKTLLVNPILGGGSPATSTNVLWSWI